MKKSKIIKYKLSNSLTLLVYPVSWINSVSIYVAVGAGSKYETVETAGLAHFLEHMLFEGTQNYPSSKKLAVYLESIGGKSGAWTDKEHVIYYVKTPTNHIVTAINYLYELLFNNLLNTNSIKNEKHIVLEEINKKNDNPEENIWDLFMEWVWGKQQWAGLSTLGNESTINKITKPRLKKYMDNLYIPKNIIVSIIGNVSIDKVRSYFSKNFGEIKKNHFIPQIHRPDYNIKKSPVKIISSNSNQNQFILGFITEVSLLNNDKYALMLLSSILSIGVSSRLFNKIVYELGYAYSFGLNNWFFSDTGFLYANGGVSTKNVIKVLDIIVTELDRLKKEEVSIKELNEAKIRGKAELSYFLENPDNIASYYSSQYLLERKITNISEFSKNIDAVTPLDIQSVAKKYLKYERLCFLIKGPIDSKYKKPIEDLFIKKFKI